LVRFVPWPLYPLGRIEDKVILFVAEKMIAYKEYSMYIGLNITTIR